MTSPIDNSTARVGAGCRPFTRLIGRSAAVLLIVGALAARGLPAETIRYTYDAAGRMVKADYGGAVAISYRYDNAGNLLSRGLVLSAAALYFPFYQMDGTTFTSFAVTNYSDRAASLEFAAFGADGRPLASDSNPARLQLPSQNQLASLGTKIFGAGSLGTQGGWVQLSSDNAEIASFFQFGGAGRLDGSLALGQAARKFYFTRVFEGPTAFRGKSALTFISVANPNDQAITIRFRLIGPEAEVSLAPIRTEVLPARGVLYKTVSELFGRLLTVSSAVIEVEVTEGPGAVGFELIRLTAADTVIGINGAVDPGTTQFFSAQLASGQLAAGVSVFTSVKLLNAAAQSRSVTLTAIGEDGNNLAAPVRITLDAGRFLEADAGELFDFGPSTAPARVGSLKVESDGTGILGDVIFGDPLALSYAASMPLQSRGLRRAIFSQVANALGFFTGIALYNPGSPGSAPAEVTLEVFSRDGRRTGERTLTLDAGRRLSQLLSDIVTASAGQAGGYVIIRSSQPLIAQQLFGDTGLSLLSAVPPTIVQ